MSTENDGMEDVVDGQFRIALTVAAQIAERIARAREGVLRKAAQGKREDAATARAQAAAERESAIAALAPTRHAEWWDAASQDDIKDLYVVAKSWEDREPFARDVVADMRHQVQERYGFDLDVDPGDHLVPPMSEWRENVPDYLRDEVEEQAEREDEVFPASSDGKGLSDGEMKRTERKEVDEAMSIFIANDLLDKEPEAGPSRDDASDHEQRIERVTERLAAIADELGMEARGADDGQLRTDGTQAIVFEYDSPERRQALRADLVELDLPDELIDGRIRTDLSNAEPPSAAVGSAPSATERPARGTGASFELERDQDARSR